MTKIIELPEILANQIAAGEVIEKPASVIKELIENSIDAAATKIIIKVQESGLRIIEVIDNGEGIASEDLPLAIRRHATSKIKSVEELFRIRTLGFRGEALPSIASVSDLLIETSREEEETGARLVVKGGEIKSCDPFSKIDGTRILVKDLFFNTPARLKYIKSLQSQLSNIIDVINRESLAHPEIAFSFYSDGKLLLQTQITQDVKQTIAQVYGIKNAKKLIKIEAKEPDFSVKGYISLPELTRATRNYISIFLNGRYIKNFALNRAIIEAYGTKLMVGRFPLAILHLTVDPYLVDVNVHPTKQEVRLSKEKEISSLIFRVIQESLKEEQLIPHALENIGSQLEISPKVQEKSLIYDTEKQDFFVQEKVEDSYHHQKLPLESSSSSIASEMINLFQSQEQEESVKIKSFPDLQYLAQLHDSYLLCQSEDAFYIVDQHAAQERVKYEYWRDKIGEVSYEQQVLLAPILIDLTQADFISVLERKMQLEDAGLFLEEYGEKQFILREHPIWMRESEIESATYELIDLLLLDKETTVKKYREDLAIMIACKSSIKAHDQIDPDSARQLLQDLKRTENPYNCPHGRPALVKFTAIEIEKMFRRIQASHKSARRNSLYD